MRRFFKLLGIIALVTVIGFSMTSCDWLFEDITTPLSGKYYYEGYAGLYIEFHGNNFTIISTIPGEEREVSGTYTRLNSILTFDTRLFNGYTWQTAGIGRVRDPAGDIWIKTDNPIVINTDALSGVYQYDNDWIIEFDGYNFTIVAIINNNNVESVWTGTGTYTRMNSTITISEEYLGGVEWEIIDENTIKTPENNLEWKKTTTAFIWGTYAVAATPTSYITFTGYNFIRMSEGEQSGSGTYTRSGNTLTISNNNWTIVDSNTIKNSAGTNFVKVDTSPLSGTYGWLNNNIISNDLTLSFDGYKLTVKYNGDQEETNYTRVGTIIVLEEVFYGGTIWQIIDENTIKTPSFNGYPNGLEYKKMNN